MERIKIEGATYISEMRKGTPYLKRTTGSATETLGRPEEEVRSKLRQKREDAEREKAYYDALREANLENERIAKKVEAERAKARREQEELNRLAKERAEKLEREAEIEARAQRMLREKAVS